MEPEFVIDEQPSLQGAGLRDAVIEAIQREYALRQTLSEKSLSNEEEVFQMRKFLKDLLYAEETRCAKLIRAYRERAADKEDPQTALWLGRLESLHRALEGVLNGYGIASYTPSGAAVSGRDEIQSTVPDTGLEPGAIVTVLKPAYLWRGEVLSAAVVLVAE